MSSCLWNSQLSAVGWRILWIVTLLLLAGCGGSNTVQVKSPEYADHSVRTLAVLAPPDDLFDNKISQLADAIGVELARRSYSVVDAKAATALLAKDGISPASVLTPQALAALDKAGADAVLSVTSLPGMGGPEMRHVKISITSTRTSKEIGSIQWNNSWGGMPESPADYVMRKGPAEAAPEIAEALARLLG